MDKAPSLSGEAWELSDLFLASGSTGTSLSGSPGHSWTMLDPLLGSSKQSFPPLLWPGVGSRSRGHQIGGDGRGEGRASYASQSLSSQLSPCLSHHFQPYLSFVNFMFRGAFLPSLLLLFSPAYSIPYCG